MQIIENAVYMGAATPGTGGTPVIDELNVTPSTSAQTITAPEGTDGYSPVNVAAVTSAIDANIVAGNIKKDVSILGVTGSYEGQTPTGTMYIISNGTYNVADKAIANVQVPTTAPEIYRVFRNNNGKLENSISTPFMPLPNSITDIGDNCMSLCYYYTPSDILYGNIDLSHLTQITGGSACSNMFNSCKGITSVDLSSLQTITGVSACYYMFAGCKGITSVDLSSLKSVTGSNSCQDMFLSCSGLTSVNISSLKKITGNTGCREMFRGCGSLPSIHLSSLEELRQQQSAQEMFTQCTSLSDIDVSSLRIIDGNQTCSQMFNSCAITTIKFSSLKQATGNSCCYQMFNNCRNLVSIYLPAIKTATGTATLLYGLTGVTIHFPSNYDPQGGGTGASSLQGYPNFGGTNTVLVYDLPANVVLTGANSTAYERSPKFDTATALAWRVNGTAVASTTYYTSTTNDPQVNDTIYSDSACTTAVTTISSIA